MGKFINNDQAKRIRSILESDEELTPEEEQKLVGLLREHASRGGIDVPNQAPIKVPNTKKTEIPEWAKNLSGGYGTALSDGVDSLYSKEDLDAAESGIDIFSGLPEPARQKFSLAVADEQRQGAIEDYFSKQGKKTFARKRGDTWEYLNPDTGRLTLVDGKKKALTPTAGGAIDVAFPTAGGIGGGVAGAAGGGPLAPVAAGGAAILGETGGAYAGTQAKNILGEFLGNKEIPQSEVNKAASKSAAETAIFSTALSAIGGAAWGIRKWVRGFDIDPNFARDALEAYRSGRSALSEYDKLAGNTSFAPTVAQVISRKGELGMMARQAEITTHSDTAGHRALQLQRDANNEHLAATFAAVNDQYDIQSPRILQEGFRGEIVRKQAHQRELARIAEQNAREAALGAGGGKPATPDELGAKLQEIIHPIYEERRAQVKERYKSLYVGLGVKPKTAEEIALGEPITSPAVSPFQAKLDDKAKKELLAFVGQARAGKEMDSALYNDRLAALPDGLVSVNPKTGAITISDKVDVVTYLDFMQMSRRGIRKSIAANKGLNIEPSPRSMAEVEQVLENNFIRQLSKENPAAIPLYQAAKDAQREFSDTFERGILSNIVALKKGTLPQTYAATFSTIVKSGDSSGAAALADVLAGSPAGRQKVKEIYMAHWSDRVLGPDEVASFTEHQKFIKDYRDSLPFFFNKQELAKLHATGDMAKVVTESRAALEAVETGWKKLRIGKLSEMNAEQLVRLTFAGGKGEKGAVLDETGPMFTEMMTFLKKNDPELLGKYRQMVANRIRGEVALDEATGIGTSINVPQYKKINTLLANHGNRIAEVFGQGYVENLRTISTAARVLQNEKKIGTGANVPLLKALVRAMFIPPLSRAGTVQTLGGVSRRFFGPKQMATILSSPEGLEWAIRNANMNIRTAQALPILSNFGMEALWAEYDE